jgi:OPT family oligopeptide transporter
MSSPASGSEVSLENAVPDGLPDLSKLPLDEREAAWRTHYFQGTEVPQLTTRAVVMGGLIGMLMAFSNLYTTLKLGWAFGVAITASVLSYSIWSSLMGLGVAKTRMTMLENNCMASTASAAGYSTGGTLATAAGAMLLITGDNDRLGWVATTGWVFFVALLGVFLAIPMKRQMINIDQLPFPSGIAAAETLRSLYAEGESAVRKARALVDSLIVGGVWGLLRSFAVIPDTIPFGGSVAVGTGSTAKVVSLKAMGIAFEPSLLMTAAGLIMGMRVCLTMLIAAIFNSFILAPLMLNLPDWTDGTKHFMGHIEVAIGDGDVITAVKVTRWSLWLGTSLLVSSGLTSFALSWRTILNAFSSFGKKQDLAVGAVDNSDIEVPNSWMLYGLIPITLGLVAVCWFSFHISPLLGVFSVVMSFALSLVAARATGETDTTPIGAMGKVTQLTYAILAPANITVNLMTAGITAGAAGSSADLLTDLKSGYLLGANPRQQFLAQFVGVFFGTLAVIPAWYLLVPDQAALMAFNPPATNMWFAVAQALANGPKVIPTSALYAIAIGALVGIALPLLEKAFPNAKKFLPSAMGLGLAFVVTFQNSLSFFLGALIAHRWAARNQKSADEYVVPVASGVIAGESLAAAGFAVGVAILDLLNTYVAFPFHLVF